MNIGRKEILTIILFGSIWGGLEATVIAASNDVNFVMPRSVILAFVSLLILTSARFLLPRRGSTLAIGVIAAGFKLLGLPNIFACQIAAVIGQAVILEAAFSVGQSRNWLQRPLQLGVMVIGASYLNSLVFGFSQAYVFGNQYWLDRGIGGLLTWSFGTGSIAALASLIGALTASAVTRKQAEHWEGFISNRKFAFACSTISVSLCFWILGILVAHV